MPVLCSEGYSCGRADKYTTKQLKGLHCLKNAGRLLSLPTISDVDIEGEKGHCNHIRLCRWELHGQDGRQKSRKQGEGTIAYHQVRKVHKEGIRMTYLRQAVSDDIPHSVL